MSSLLANSTARSGRHGWYRWVVVGSTVYLTACYPIPHTTRHSEIFTGTVLDASNDQPISKAKVEVVGFPSTREKTDKEGRFRVGPARLFHLCAVGTDPTHEIPPVPNFAVEPVSHLSVSMRGYESQVIYVEDASRPGASTIPLVVEAGTVRLTRKEHAPED